MFKRYSLIPQAAFIAALLAALLSIPNHFVESVRCTIVAAIAPFTSSFLYGETEKEEFAKEETTFDEEREEKKKPLSQIELENQLLRNENQWIRELVEHELHMIAELSYLVNGDAERVKLHREILLNSLDKELISLPAKVIFRSPASWNSSLWIDVGENDNEKFGKKIIEKNSPVLVGKHVVGVVDYVGTSHSRVRLITDSGLTPSVRAARGSLQNIQVQEEIQVLRTLLATGNTLFSSAEEKKSAIEELDRIKNLLIQEKENFLLAKGVLQGSSSEMWRKSGQKLKGFGFNYDYSDAEGPARDLRTGIPINAPDTIPTVPIIKEGDTLVTTGYDGLFPAGLTVAIVTHIELLKEGDYFYELEALPSAGDLDSLDTLYILPKIGGREEKIDK